MILRARADHIKALMARKRITSQTQLGIAMGVSHASISRQLNGVVAVSAPFIAGCRLLWPKARMEDLFDLVHEELDEEPAAA